MKKCYRYCAGPACTGCAQQTFTGIQKQTGSSSTKGNHITHHFFVSGIGQKKTVDAAKICGGAEMLLKQKPSKHS